MGEQTNISWCDATFNPVIGCTKVSPACDGCYAWARNKRFKDATWGEPGTKSVLYRTSPSNWALLRRWHRKALKEGTRPFVFGGSLCDPFDNDWPPEWRRDYFDLIRECPALVLLLLTKRPQNIVKLSRAAGGLPPNVALGTTTEDQIRFDQNMPHLSHAAAHFGSLFTFISAEPLLGPIELGGWLPAIDWVIAGGETDQGGHLARPYPAGSERSLRDQCAAVGIPFHWKQNLGGTRKSGRLLDGEAHDGRPEVPAL